jgi:hypothetical protein
MIGMDDQNKVDEAVAPKSTLVMQIAKAVLLAALLTLAAWIATSYALDWMGSAYH